MTTLMARVQSVLSDDLLRPRYRRTPDRHPHAGHCYVASEALYHLGYRAVGFRPHVVTHEGGTHWYLRHRNGRVVDPTAGQFATPPDYDAGRCCGFLTRAPSRRAAELIRRAKKGSSSAAA